MKHNNSKVYKFKCNKCLNTHYAVTKPIKGFRAFSFTKGKPPKRCYCGGDLSSAGTTTVSKLRSAEQKQTKKGKRKAKAKKKSSGLGGALFLIILLAGVVFIVSGCTQYPECDQTQHGRGNVPAACKSLTYQGGE